jgi:hypothetical protein
MSCLLGTREGLGEESGWGLRWLMAWAWVWEIEIFDLKLHTRVEDSFVMGSFEM